MTIRVLDPSNERHATTLDLRNEPSPRAAKPWELFPTARRGTKGYFRHFRAPAARGVGRRRCRLAHQVNYSAPAEAEVVDEKSRTGRPLSPASAIEAAARRAVCMTRS